MDNATRSENTRRKAIEAALAILTKDGMDGLTFDALAIESGISKGGLLHQFRSKKDVLEALIEHQRHRFEQIAQAYLAEEGAGQAQQTLCAQIAIFRESVNQPQAVARAALATLVASPNAAMLENFRNVDADNRRRIESESSDRDLSLVRLFAAIGLAYSTLIGTSSIPKKDRDRLFLRLLDESAWGGGSTRRKKKKR